MTDYLSEEIGLEVMSSAQICVSFFAVVDDQIVYREWSFDLSVEFSDGERCNGLRDCFV